eukprot:XP_001693988.1 predicted protein [Chlamydomonas reinhardtii]
MFHLLLALFCLSLLPWRSDAAFCSEAPDGKTGQFCSWHKTKGFIGGLDSTIQLKAALEATAWEKEIILTVESRVSGAGQFLQRYRKAGWSHVLVVMDRPSSCFKLARLMAPYTHLHGPISCGHYSTADPATGKPLPSRAVAMGYNVLAVDSDTVVLDDWYRRVKTPPLSSINMFSQSESVMTINGGFTYIQNAKSNGPITWILYEAVHRAVRWSEDCSRLRQLSTALADKDTGLPTDDQTMLTEAMLSALAGRPLFYAVMHKLAWDSPDWKKMFPGGIQEYDNYHFNMSGAKLIEQEYTQELPLSELVCDAWPCVNPPPGTLSASGSKQATFRLRSAELTMPHFGGEWPQQLGGQLFGVAGDFTLAYRAAYQDLHTALGVPLPPDPEDPATQQAAAATPKETFALLSTMDTGMPCEGCDPWVRTIRGAWLESAWWSVGRYGHWHSHLYPRFRPAIGHVHVNTLDGTSDTKNLILKLADLSEGGSERVYYATAADREARREHQPLLRVVAYAPGVVHSGLTKDEFLRAAEELARVALALGAVAGWPAAPCDADWVLSTWGRNLTRPIRHSIPWVHINTTDVVQPFGDSLDSLQCEWTGFMHTTCLASPPAPADTGRGLLAVELRHLLGWLPERHGRPAPDNTARLALGGAAAGEPPAPGTSNTFVHVTYADLVQVGGSGSSAESRYQRWKERCRALQYRTSDLRNRVKF